jgi:hypothetical protein
LLAALASVALGRASHQDIEIWSKGSRYYEMAVLLVPFSVALLLNATSSAPKRLKRMRGTAVGGMALLFLFGHLNNWSFSHYYWTYDQKLIGKKCALAAETTSELEKCATIWGMGTVMEIQRAKSLPLSWGQGGTAP